MNRFFGFLLVGLAFYGVSGCDRPEVPRSEYGQIIDELPDFPHSPKILPVPEEIQPDLDRTGSF